MTVCNMSIEGGARCGYVNPDETTFAYLRGRALRAAGRRPSSAPSPGGAASRATPDARYDDRVEIDGASDRADRHLGHQPRPERRRRRAHPAPASSPDDERALARGGLAFMDLRAGRADRGHDDRRRLHRLVHQRAHLGSARGGARRAQRAAWRPACGRCVVPGSQAVRAQAEAEGLPRDLPRRGLRVARGRLLDVPRDEPRQARRARDVRVVQQPQLQGPPGLAHRPHAADVARRWSRPPRCAGASSTCGRCSDGEQAAAANRAAAAACCAATTSTPIASSPRATCARHLRRPRRARLRGRPQAGQGQPPVRRRALRRRAHPGRRPQLRLRLVARARAPGADALRLQGASSASRSPRSSSATARARAALP